MTEIIEIPLATIDRIGCYLNPDVNVEASYLPFYSLEREEDPYTIIAKNFLSSYFKEEQPIDKITTFFNPDNYINVVTNFIEKVDIVLLNKIEDLDFKNVIYDKFENDIYYFKVIPRIKE